MKNKLLVILLSLIMVFSISGCDESDVKKEPVESLDLKETEIIGEWGYSNQKNNTAGVDMNVKFDESGKFEWIMPDDELEPDGRILFKGTYIASDTLSLILSPGEIVELDYSIDNDILEIDGDYFERGKNLDFTPTPEKLVEKKEPEKEEPVEVVKPVSIDLSAGMYIVGEDIPPGKYTITALSGRGNFFGGPGIVSEIMGFGSEYAIETYNNAIFKNGDEIEITRTLVVNLTSK